MSEAAKRAGHARGAAGGCASSLRRGRRLALPPAAGGCHNAGCDSQNCRVQRLASPILVPVPAGSAPRRSRPPGPPATSDSADGPAPNRTGGRCNGRHSRVRLAEDDQGSFRDIEFLRQPLIGGAQGAHFWVAGHFHAASFGHELRLLPGVKWLGADAQLPGRGLRAANLQSRAQGLGLKHFVVFVPFAGRCPADFGCHNRRNMYLSSVLHF